MDPKPARWMPRAYRWMTLWLVVFLGLAPVGPALAQPAEARRLVRIDVPSAAELAPLADLGVPVYTQMADPGGRLVVVAEATPDQQAALTARGLSVTDLGPAVPAGELFLLYGRPEAIQAAGAQVMLLATAGRQAVARGGDAQMETLARQGLATQHLSASPLPAIDLQLQAQAAAPLAPDVVYNPVVQGMVNAVTQSTLSTYVAQLSGEQLAPVGGTPRDIESRFTMNEQQINWATRFAYEHLSGLGLTTDYDYFDMPYGGIWYEKRNVVAQQTGLTQPNRIFLLTAHIDSYSGGASQTDAPGADDNASGSAALLAIADVLSQYSFACTLRYALFTGEEQGLYGSKAYSARMRARNENIEGVLNLDMLGYSTPGSAPQIELHTRPGNAGDLYYANLFRDAVTTYSLPLTPVILQDSLSFSDHSPFWNQGYPAILAIEDWDDHTPYYHTTGDTLASLNMGYYTAFAKAAIATFAHMGCLSNITAVGGAVTEAGTGSALSNVMVTAWQGAQLVQRTWTQPGGNYLMLVDPGTYMVRFEAPNYRSVNVTGVAVGSGQTVALDRTLQPCVTINNLVISPSITWAQPGQAVTLQALVGNGQTPINYTWNFGDGSGASGLQQVQHTYTQPGVYPYTLMANNTCDLPVWDAGVALIDVTPQFLPLVSN